MAEKQAMMPQVLVLDSNREKLAKRIETVGLDLRRELLERQREAFCKLFTFLSKKYFKLRKHDLLSLLEESKESDKELLALEFEIFGRAKRGYKFTKYIFLPLFGWVPFIGWAMAAHILSKDVVGYHFYLGNGFDGLNYCKLRRILMEKYGKDFFPFDMLKQYLNY